MQGWVFLEKRNNLKQEKLTEWKLQQSYEDWEHGEICNNCRGK